MNNRWAVLAVLCLATFTINVATMIVNVALPSLTRELGASTRDLLWIVDAFNLVFAALVLAAGSLSDRYGRKGALVVGLLIYLAGSLAGAWSDNADELVIWRAVAGLGAAVVFPTTLSIIANVFADRGERVGPIVGGALLESYWWGSAFVFCAGLAAMSLVFTVWLVPTSRDPAVPPLDIRGLVLSTVTLGVLVYSIIEAPERGWGSAATLGGFAIAGAAGLLFVMAE